MSVTQTEGTTKARKWPILPCSRCSKADDLHTHDEAGRCTSAGCRCGEVPKAGGRHRSKAERERIQGIESHA